MKKIGFGGYMQNFDSNNTSLVVEFPAGKKRWIESITCGFGAADTYNSAVLDTAMVAVIRGSISDDSKPWNYTLPTIDADFTGALFLAVWQIQTLQHFRFGGAGLELPEDQVISVVLPNPFDTTNVPPNFDSFVGTLSVLGREDSLRNPFERLR